MPISQERQREIIQRLTERGANLACPRCGNNQFSLVDSYLSHSLQDNINHVQIGGRAIPLVATICNRCGFMSSYALGTLGLMQEQEQQQPAQANAAPPGNP